MLDHLDDLESDFSVFHRIDDIWEMPAPRFFAFANRIGWYRGAVRGLAELEQQNGSSGGGAPQVQTRRVEATTEQLASAPEFAARDGYAPVFEVVAVPSGGGGDG